MFKFAKRVKKNDEILASALKDIKKQKAEAVAWADALKKQEEIFEKNPVKANVCKINIEKMNDHLFNLENLFADETKENNVFYGMFGKEGKLTYELIDALGYALLFEPHSYEEDYSTGFYNFNPRLDGDSFSYCNRSTCKEVVDDFNEKMEALITKVKNRLNSDDARLAILEKMNSFLRQEGINPGWEAYKETKEVSDFTNTKFYLVVTSTEFLSSSVGSISQRLESPHIYLLEIPWRYKDTNFHVVTSNYLDVNYNSHKILDISSLETYWDEELFENVHGIYQDGSDGLTLSEAVEVAKHI